jgi:alkylated DNA repair dioxygenase AlkB
VSSGGLEDNPEATQDGALHLDVNAAMHELLPGFVHMKSVLPASTQQALLDMSCAVAFESRQCGTSGGWYRLEQNGRWSLNDGNKARFWDDISRFPSQVKSLGERLASLAGHNFPQHLETPSAAFNARVGALNFYTARGRMGWHVDDTNFAKAERPIVMANLGDAADFGYKLIKSDPDLSVRLESGDAVVFGGPARNLMHALLQVHPHTSPKEMQFPEALGVGRVSVTWRDVGAEDGLTFNSDERLGLKVTDQTLARYLKGKRSDAQGEKSQYCAQCRAPLGISNSRRPPVYCSRCWEFWQGCTTR